MSRFTATERSAILRGAEAACATASDLRETVAQLRSDADGLRSESVKLRRRALAVREERRP